MTDEIFCVWLISTVCFLVGCLGIVNALERLRSSFDRLWKDGGGK